MSEENNNTPSPTPAPTVAPTPVPSPTEAPSPKPWYESRIDSLTREKYEQADELSKLKTEVEKLKTAATPTPTPTIAPVDLTKKPINMTQEEFDNAVKLKAAQQSQVDAFNSACNTVYKAGETAYSDFKDSVNNFTKLGGLPVPLVEAALELDNTHEILYELSKDLDKAEEIFKLSPAKQAIALSKFSIEMKKEKKKPDVVNQVVGGNRGTKGDPDPEKMTMQEFIAWREKQNNA